QAVPDEELTIRIGWRTETDMDVLSEFCPKEDTQPAGEKKKSESLEDGFGFAIDIGTTTLAIQLIDLETGECRKTYTGLNPQRTCGADVISRIKASVEGKGPLLKELIREALHTGMEQLCRDCAVPWEAVRKVVIAGNTTMIHLLM